jgi:hypothetical protein
LAPFYLFTFWPGWLAGVWDFGSVGGGLAVSRAIKGLVELEKTQVYLIEVYGEKTR